jgi:hypothetical protein
MTAGSLVSYRPPAAALGLLLVCILLGAVACGPGPALTQESFQQVRDDMTTTEVKAPLGEPTAVTTRSLPVLGTVTTYEYKTERSDVELHFRDDRLKVKIGSVRD